MVQEPFAFSTADFLRFLILTIIVAPPNFLWQGWLERTFPARRATVAHTVPNPESLEMGEGGRFLSKSDEDARGEQGQKEDFSWANTFKKWFVDCMTVGAIGNTLAFLIIMGLMKGKSLQDIHLAIRKVC